MDIETIVINALAVAAAGAAACATGVQFAEWRETRGGWHFVAGVSSLLWAILLVGNAIEGAQTSSSVRVDPLMGRSLLVLTFAAIAGLSWPWGSRKK